MISKNVANIFFFFLRAWTLFISEKPLNLSPYQQKTAPPSPLEDVEEATHEKSNMIDDILTFNKQFVAEKRYEEYITSGQPNRKLAVLTCMDTRLTELLPKSMGLKNGDAKIIKVAGGTMISHYDSVMRSLLVAVYELGCEEIMVVHHSDCGLCHMEAHHFEELMREKGVTDEALEQAAQFVNLDEFLHGFDDIEADVQRMVEAIKQHPLMPRNFVVRGFMIDSLKGELTEVV